MKLNSRFGRYLGKIIPGKEDCKWKDPEEGVYLAFSSMCGWSTVSEGENC